MLNKKIRWSKRKKNEIEQAKQVQCDKKSSQASVSLCPYVINACLKRKRERERERENNFIYPFGFS